MDFLTNIFGGGGGADAAPAAPATQGRSIFEPSGNSAAGVFDPFAFAGRAMGLPTTAERVGGISGAALSELGRITQEEGLPPEQAILKFLSTPQGQQWFASGDDVMKTLGQFKTTVTPPMPQVTPAPAGSDVYQSTPHGGTNKIGSTPLTPAQRATRAPSFHNVPGAGGMTDVLDESGRVIHSTPGSIDTAPGHARMDPRTGRFSAINPTTKQQDFNFFGNLSGAPASRLRELAEAEITPDNMRPDKVERALNSLVSNGIINPAQRAMYLTGAWEVKEVTNSFGEGLGRYMMINKLDGTHMPIAPGTRYHSPTGSGFPEIPQSTQAPPAGPGTQPFGSYVPGRGQAQPDTAGNSMLPQGPNAGPVRQPVAGRDTMALGSGFNSASMSMVASIMGTINPAFQTEGTRTNENRRQAIEMLKTSLMGAAADQGTMGVPRTVIDQWIKVAGLDTGFFSGPPGKAIQGLIGLSDNVLNERNRWNEIARDEGEARKVRTEARNSAIKLDRVLENLPPRGVLEEMDKNIREGTAGAPDAWETIKNTYGMMFDASMGRAPHDAQPPAASRARDIQGMNDQQLRGLDPATLSQSDRAAYRKRAAELGGAPKPTPTGSPSQRSNFAAEDLPSPAGDVSTFVNDPEGTARSARGAPSSGILDKTVEQRLEQSFQMLEQAIAGGKVTSAVPERGPDRRLRDTKTDARFKRNATRNMR